MPLIIADISSFLLNGFFIALGIWFIVLVAVIISLVNRKDMPLPVKLFWALVLVVAPVVGLIIYLAVGVRSRRRRIARQ